MSYICLHAPSESYIACDRLSKSLSDALTIARSPDIPDFPASMDAYCAFSASVNSENAALVSRISISKSFVSPFASVRDNPSSSNAVLTCLVGAAMREIHDRRDVPADDALIPLFAMIPRAVDTS